ncbi:MAG TPA: 50S ribosomal protein L18 [Chloroflexota bacterium]|nr:50S ribosomal protein L18 [Chloroflexota bacterium]
MYKQNDVRETRRRKHARVRARVEGSPERPRLAVFRSSAHIYAQVIDDVARRTLVAASDIDSDGKAEAKGDKTARAKAVGLLIAKRAKAAGVNKVVFDRGGYLYHGRVKALAEAAREGGLEF